MYLQLLPIAQITAWAPLPVRFEMALDSSLVAQTVKRLPTMWETRVQSLCREDLVEKEMATHSSVLAWKIPWMEEPGRLQSMGSWRVGHDWATSLSLLDSFKRVNPTLSCLCQGSRWYAPYDNHPQTIPPNLPPGLWRNCFLQNLSLVPKRLGPRA